jgi:alpha-D-ribose 1-methylphosphonate 5-triphosphate synthase subunit PhnH
MMSDLVQPVPGLSVWHPATQQLLYRRLQDCYAHPGRIATCRDTDRAPLTALLATLLDAEVSLADLRNMIAANDLPKLEVRTCPPQTADFVVCNGTLPPDLTPRLGTLESPELGATLLLQVTVLGKGQLLHLHGPGIKGQTELAVSGLHPGWLAARENWLSSFPLGVDIILCDTQQFAALPRTTHIKTEVF